MTAAPQPDRLRIALLAPSLAAGGAERQMLLLARELRKDHDVSLFVMQRGGPFEEAARRLGLPIRELGWPPRPWRRNPGRYAAGVARAVVTYIALARHVDVVDAWLPSAYALAGLAQPLARVPVLVAGRRSMWAHLRTAPAPRRFAAALGTRRAHVVVANSQAVARAAADGEGIAVERIRVIRNAVDIPPADSGEARRQTRVSWGLGEDDVVVGSVASLRPGKGIEPILELAARVGRRRSDVRFVLVGDGPLRPDVERAIRDRGLTGTVILHGADADARSLYAGFDVVAHASTSEGLPNVVLEAAAAGVAIVATDVGGTGEVVRDGQEGFLVPAGNVDALERAVVALIDDPALRLRLGGAARARAGEFSVDRLAAETIALYRSVLATRRPRATTEAPARLGTTPPSG